MGHLLLQLGFVDQRLISKYKHEASKLGKGSFAFAWVLDETAEERERGVTMDIARTYFETTNKKVVLLDAPGHKDFIPNMITGAAQADAALLVVNATRGEFETGFDQGGQTREHVMLLRSFGVNKIAVAVNKMDTVEWSEDRFNQIVTKMKQFLVKQAGFSDVQFVPLSGLEGVNLTKSPGPEIALTKWYTGPTLVDLIDGLPSGKHSEEAHLRVVISDVVKSSDSSI
uniref:Tr-type G domain-containing protein n=1 Tax=Steinernema glaseri TaxID=37863 RepID=A0A1I8A1T0_9BILA